jgi:N-acetylglucosaminyldiphosphoundecaprenol N-acetyl-beta-D-mannosaminyltransferase
MTRGSVKIGPIVVDSVTFDGALGAIAELVDRRNGGAVFTPNVDHVVKAESNAEFRAAYSRADLRLADGMPILWAAKILGSPLPEKVSGSDLIMPLAQFAARREWRVYLLGGGHGVAEQAADKFSRELGLNVVGTDSPVVDLEGNAERPDEMIDKLLAAKPDLVLVALGAPKQELWIDRFGDRIKPAVAMGVGGSLDFVVGRVTRAPAWMSRAGLEWLFRLWQEPRRMWRRYLIEDPKFIAIVARTRRQRRIGRSG